MSEEETPVYCNVCGDQIGTIDEEEIRKMIIRKEAVIEINYINMEYMDLSNGIKYIDIEKFTLNGVVE